MGGNTKNPIIRTTIKNTKSRIARAIPYFNRFAEPDRAASLAGSIVGSIKIKREMQYQYLPTPIGKLTIVGDESAIHHILLPNQLADPQPDWMPAGSTCPVADCARQLREYFAGARQNFDLPLKPSGTPFQRKVWETLLDIPFGETIAYSELAKRVGKPKAARAVGSANGANRIAIVIPCHRVIAADGTLGGYGGGLDVKQQLLDLEAPGA